MLRLKKYLRPFIWMIMSSMCLLFISSICDLKLPDTMSKIVNIGIQQSGIEHASASVMSEEAFKLLTVLMNDEDEDYVRQYYTSIDCNGKACVQLKEGSEEQRSELDEIISLADWTLISVMEEMNPSMSDSSLAVESMNIEEIDLTQLYQLTPRLEMMDLSEAREQAYQQDASMRLSTGVVFAKLFYEEIGEDTAKIQQNYILKQGGIMLMIALAGILATIGVSYCSSRIGTGLSRNLRKDVFEKVESFSSAEFNKFSASSLITRTTNDIQQVQGLVVMGLRMICQAPILGIGALIMIFRRNTSMVWILGVAVLAVSCLILFMFVFAMPKFKVIQKLIDRLNLVSRENLNGLMVVRAFRGQPFEKKRFESANHDLTKTNLYIQRIMAFMMPCMNMLMNFVMLLIIWVGAHQIAQSNMQVGDMMAFMQYAMQVIMSFVMIAMMFVMVPRASVSAGRVADVLETQAIIQDPVNPKEFIEEKRGYVEFEHVSFSYDGASEHVLSDITFTAKPAETTAIIGSTGSGKTTLVNLIPRFYDVTEGSIKVSGVDVREVRQYDLHQEIGYVAQKGLLLSGTINSNISYGNPNMSEEEIKTVAAVAQASEFIETKENGYDSDIAQGGNNVSGGQKQRLSIARALAVNAPIYIFDDSFSALDFKTDAALRAALKQHTSNATVIIVAQRISSIINAEQIIVLDEGKIVGRGTHQELLDTCPTYYEIASSQLSKEEL